MNEPSMQEAVSRGLGCSKPHFLRAWLLKTSTGRLIRRGGSLARGNDG